MLHFKLEVKLQILRRRDLIWDYSGVFVALLRAFNSNTTPNMMKNNPL